MELILGETATFDDTETAEEESRARVQRRHGNSVIGNVNLTRTWNGSSMIDLFSGRGLTVLVGVVWL